jgi:hypothetical protein
MEGFKGFDFNMMCMGRRYHIGKMHNHPVVQIHAELSDALGRDHEGIYCRVVGYGKRNNHPYEGSFNRVRVVELLNGEFHSNGATYRFKDGKLHSDGDNPAEITRDGDKFYYFEGLLHRDNNKPAVEYATGGVEYFCHGKRHRDGNAPAVVRENNGLQVYFQHDVIYREGNQPAIVFPSTENAKRIGQ